jgi:CRISPR/Cas system CSM-associated protein Csm5 (group 7 of RAMP superfamily)
MDNTSTMILKLRTLTPLHIGDGSTLHPFDFTVLDGRFYRCSPRFFERFLDQLGPQAGDQFVKWSGDIMDKMVALDQNRRIDPRLGKDYNQNMSALRRAHTLHEFAKNIKQEQAFIDFLRANAPWIPNQPVGKGERPKQEYRGFQRGGDGTAFLPGSSVKGSIRTALLYCFLEKHTNNEAVRRILEENIATVKKEKMDTVKRKFRYNPTRHLKSFGEKLEQLVFFATMSNEKGQKRYQEAQDDLMRCLLVSDTHVLNTDMGMENIDLYLVKKQAKFDGGGFEGQRQTQAPAVEAIQPGTNLEIRLDFNAELLLQLHRQQSDEGLRIGRETHFIGWRERAETLFNLTTQDFAAVPEKAKPDHPTIQALRQKALDHTIACCRTFSDAQALALTRWADNFGKYAREKYMAHDLDAGTEAVFSATGARLHLGFATGFEGMTVVLHLLANHKKQFADLMDLFGIGDSPSAWKDRRPGQEYIANPNRFPTSRRLATRARAIFSLGWLEWADDPKAGPAKQSVLQNYENELAETPFSVQTTPPTGPVFLRGTLKQGAELDAELLEGGNPGRFKLFIREDYFPEVEIKYAAGFKTEDIGRFARLRIKNMSGKSMVVEFVRYK